MGKDYESKFNYPPDFTDPDIPRGVLSPSQFDMYRRCPRQYSYRYVQNLISAPGIAAARGRAVHKGAEVTHKHTIEHGEPLPLEDATQSVADAYDTEIEDVELAEDEKSTDLGLLKDRTLYTFRTYYQDAVPKIRPVKVEHAFAVKIGVVPVRGFIDLVDSVEEDELTVDDDPENPPRIEVVSDLKLTGRKWPPQKVRHAPQLTFYAIVENTDRVRVDLLLDQKTGTRYEPLKSRRDVTDKRVLVEDVEEVVDYIKKGIFPRCDPTSWVCTEKFCGYYSRCRGPK